MTPNSVVKCRSHKKRGCDFLVAKKEQKHSSLKKLATDYLVKDRL